LALASGSPRFVQATEEKRKVESRKQKRQSLSITPTRILPLFQLHILITGACGFVGSSLCRAMAEAGLGWTITGLDNLGRRGSELNRPSLQAWGVNLIHGDLRCPSDVAALPRVD
jgi:hypothetical protein